MEGFSVAPPDGQDKPEIRVVALGTGREVVAPVIAAMAQDAFDRALADASGKISETGLLAPVEPTGTDVVPDNVIPLFIETTETDDPA